MLSGVIPWETLNPEQREAVEAWDCALLVMAPVGTGKTNVLTLRAANAMEHGVEPASMLCLSFTNKAAREVKERLTLQLGKAGAEITAKTFHGLCAEILRAEASLVGWDRDFIIYDEEDSRSLIGEVASRQGIKPTTSERNTFEFLLFDAAQKARLSEFEERPTRQPQQVFDSCLAASKLEAWKRRGGLLFKPLLAEYVHALRDSHAVDFADLIVGVNRLWRESSEALKRWQARFAWIQIDEVQDTNRGEWAPLASLAAEHRRLSFFGDVDQTIYQWRGSVPEEILADFKLRFAPVREISFTRNYRSTRTILEACERVIRACPGAHTKRIVAQVADEGEPLRFHEATDPRDEARWISEQVKALRARCQIEYGDIAVLARSNFTARELSRHFNALELPHLKVEEFKFFQRAEIKAALAHLRLLINPHDAASLERFLHTPPKGIGQATVDALAGEPREAGLKPGDLLNPATYTSDDPFAPLLAASREGRVVVFDIETTGLRIGEDEIVEIAAAKTGVDGVEGEFHAYLKPVRTVGDSELVHHISDAMLEREGRDAREVLSAFQTFCEGCVLAGHNVALFDVPMLVSALRHHGFPQWTPPPVFDTLDITRRFHRLPRYTLGEIVRRLGLQSKPTHRADADVAATVELLLELLPRLEQGAAARLEAVRKFGPRFRPLALLMEGWRARMGQERPDELMERVMRESGLLRYYEREEGGPSRRENLDELLKHLRRFDAPLLAPEESLQNVLAIASLGKEIDGQTLDKDKVLLLTVHQAKGAGV